MKELYVNGIYLTDKVSGGVRRAATEIVRALKEIEGVRLIVLCPPEASVPTEEDGVEYRRIGRCKSNLWEQISLARYLKKNPGICLNLCNAYPVRAKNNFVIFHDVRPIEEKLEGKKSLFIAKFHFLLKRAKKKNLPILTVSQFSKRRICELYGYDPDRISVIRLGHEHLQNHIAEEKKSADDWGEYYLSVSSIMPHKNFALVMQLARLHPNKAFYIIGQRYDDSINELPENVKYLGRLSDGELAAYYRHATAFIAPSLYEGFGLTPLEAIYFGCKRVYCSDIDVFHEIYGGLCSYFDPHVPESFDFGMSHTITETERNVLLENFTWRHCAEDILNAINALAEKK